MSTPERRARDTDRDAAIEIVEAAWADGQIIEADRDKRVEELLRAQTLREIDLFTRDLQVAAAPSEAEPEPEPEPEPPLVNYGPAPTSLGEFSISPGAPQRVARLPKALFVIPVVAILLVVVAVTGAIFAVSDGDGGSFGTDAPAKSEVLTAQGYDDLVAAVDEEIGSTQVFDAVLYPEYAVVSVPVDATSNREGSWYWDGSELRDNDFKSTSSAPRFDLTTVDGQVVVDLVDQARPLVEDATSWYVIVRAPDAEQAMVWAYASNEYGETAYLGATLDGTVVYDSTQH